MQGITQHEAQAGMRGQVFRFERMAMAGQIVGAAHNTRRLSGSMGSATRLESSGTP
jgi:hypothetical protein